MLKNKVELFLLMQGGVLMCFRFVVYLHIGRYIHVDLEQPVCEICTQEKESGGMQRKVWEFVGPSVLPVFVIDQLESLNKAVWS